MLFLRSLEFTLDIPLVSDMISAGEIRRCTRDLLPPRPQH